MSDNPQSQVVATLSAAAPVPARSPTPPSAGIVGRQGSAMYHERHRVRRLMPDFTGGEDVATGRVFVTVKLPVLAANLKAEAWTDISDTGFTLVAEIKCRPGPSVPLQASLKSDTPFSIGRNLWVQATTDERFLTFTFDPNAPTWQAKSGNAKFIAETQGNQVCHLTEDGKGTCITFKVITSHKHARGKRNRDDAATAVSAGAPTAVPTTRGAPTVTGAAGHAQQQQRRPTTKCYFRGCNNAPVFKCTYAGRGEPGCASTSTDSIGRSCRTHASRVCQLCESWECQECSLRGSRHPETDTTRYLEKCGTCSKSVCKCHQEECFLECSDCGKIVCKNCPHGDWSGGELEDGYDIAEYMCPGCAADEEDEEGSNEVLSL